MLVLIGLYNQLLIMSIIAGLLYLILKLFSIATHKYFSAAWHYYTYFLISTFFLIPYYFVLSAFNIFTRKTAKWAQSTLIELGPPPSDIISTVSTSTIQISPKSHEAFSYIRLLPYFLVAGTLIFIAVVVCKNIRINRRIFIACQKTDDRVLLDILSECKRSIGLKKEIPVYICSFIGTPLVTGLFRPRIVLSNIEFSSEELGYIFKHELTHIKKYDAWIKLLLLFINALHWFNPLAYIIRLDIDRFCEAFCDKTVTGSMNKEERRKYSGLILSVLWNVADQNTKLFSAFSDKRSIERRIYLIMKTEKSKRWVRRAAVAFTLSFALVGTGLAYAATGTGSANAPLSTSGTANVSGLSADFENMEVGDIVYVGDIAIQRVADDAQGPGDSMVQTTTEGFSVSDFAGNQSLDKTMSLNSTYKYWFIWIDNTSNNTINVTIGNDEATQTNNFHQIAKGKYYVWSTNAWPTSSQTVSFSNGAGMYGSAAARLCSTLAEAVAHNG